MAKKTPAKKKSAAKGSPTKAVTKGIGHSTVALDRRSGPPKPTDKLVAGIPHTLIFRKPRLIKKIEVEGDNQNLRLRLHES
jgi:hypothetical protein